MTKYKEKLALDSQTHLNLLTDLFNVEEMMEQEENVEALKVIKKLIDEVRYSAIIEDFKLMEE